MNRQDQRIVPLKLGITNCYLIRGGENYVLVDAGPPNALDKFRKKLDRLMIAPALIKLILITHQHFDHTGSIEDISRLTGAESAMHPLDKDPVEKGIVNMPNGHGTWGKFLRLFLWTIKPMIKRAIEPVTIDRRLDNTPWSLDKFQVNGKVFHTPGHTPGSISLVLNSGEAFVGDLAMSGFPRVSGPGPFVLGENLEIMKQSWRLLLDEGARRIYPSHGKPFDAREFEKYLKA
jgi:glyoxylase-like metal-dependent hydrolase (beta-lactamase superfamily II)